MNPMPRTSRFDRLRTGRFDRLRTCLFGIVLAAATGSNAEELGRLFFTPEQRAQLESRQQYSSQGSTHSIAVNGIVQKHGGNRTAWINGMPQAAGKSNEHAPESVHVALPGQAQPVEIKVGQKILISPSASAQPLVSEHSSPSGQ